MHVHTYNVCLIRSRRERERDAYVSEGEYVRRNRVEMGGPRGGIVRLLGEKTVEGGGVVLFGWCLFFHCSNWTISPTSAEEDGLLLLLLLFLGWIQLRSSTDRQIFQTSTDPIRRDGYCRPGVGVVVHLANATPPNAALQHFVFSRLSRRMQKVKGIQMQLLPLWFDKIYTYPPYIRNCLV